MKSLLTLLTALALLATVPVTALAAKEEKKDAKTKKEDKKKEKEKEEADKKKMMAKEKKEILYTATISSSLGDPTEADVGEVKSLLSVANAFKCKEVKLDGKQIVATLAIATGRLSKSDVSKMLKEKSNLKVEKLDDIKPEKEKKDKDKDKADDKKEEPKK